MNRRGFLGRLLAVPLAAKAAVKAWRPFYQMEWFEPKAPPAPYSCARIVDLKPYEEEEHA